MAVDEAGGVHPTREWMQAAQRALETDGILDGSPSKRHKVCICTCTLMSQHTCTPKLLGESLSEDVPVRVSRAYILLERILLFPKKSSPLKKGPLRLPPKSLPNHCRSTAEALPKHCRSTLRPCYIGAAPGDPAVWGVVSDPSFKFEGVDVHDGINRVEA